MENNNEISIPLNTNSLDAKTQDIAQQILNETDIDKVKDLTNLFNLNANKRNVMRILKMNNILDKVTDEVMTRVENIPQGFSNMELVKYMEVAENAIDKASKNLNLVEETPAIQLQQNNQININMESQLDRESRQKVTDIVSKLLKTDTIDNIIGSINTEEISSDES